MSDPEKVDSSSIAKNSHSSVGVNDSSALYRPEIDTSNVDSKKLMRRVDIHVIPWLALLYLANFIDRGTIGSFSYFLQQITC